MSRLPPGVRRRGQRFEARWRNESGRQRSATFDTAAEAYAHAVRCAGGADVADASAVAAGEWIPRWQAAATGRLSTRARDDSYLRTHVVPAFAHRQLAAITTWEVQEWVTGLGDRLAPGSVHKVHGVLSKLLGSAVSAGLLAVNPCRGVQLPALPDVEARFLTPNEIARLDLAVQESAPHWPKSFPW